MNDFEEIKQGKNNYNIMLKYWKISDFVVTLEKRRNGYSSLDEFYVVYHPSKFSTYRRSPQIHKTIDEAILFALSLKYTGLNSQASEFMCKMLEMDDDEKQIWSQ